MKPPKPWPPWWHAHWHTMPGWVHPGEALAYEDLRLLRARWKARRDIASHDQRRRVVRVYLLADAALAALCFFVAAGLVRGCL